MGDVTIEIFPQLTGEISKAFSYALLKAVLAGKTELVYRKTTFRIDYRADGTTTNIRVVYSDLGASLPPVFQSGELKVRAISLRSKLPPKLRAAAGTYVGANFGLPHANCFVDPDGYATGEPQILVEGENLIQVVLLYRRVMTGKLTPGYDGDIWNSMVYRR